MKYEEAKYRFIEAWGTLGTSWGINKVMAQIHALLITSARPMTTDDVMDELQISRGNANMNIRALMEWGIVEKKLIVGERKDHYVAGKDIWELARQVSRERRKREIEPILKVLSQVQKVEGESDEVKEFKKVTQDLKEFSQNVDNALEKFTKSDKNWFLKLLMRL